MKLSDLGRGECAEVLSVSPAFAARLAALGLEAGGEVCVLAVSFARRTFLVQAGSVRLILASEIVDGVQIWRR